MRTIIPDVFKCFDQLAVASGEAGSLF